MHRGWCQMLCTATLEVYIRTRNFALASLAQVPSALRAGNPPESWNALGLHIFRVWGPCQRTLNTIWPMLLAKVLMAKVMLLMMTFLLAVLLILVSLNSSASPK